MKAYTFKNGILLIDERNSFIEFDHGYKLDFPFELKPTNDNSFRKWVGDENFKKLANAIYRGLANGQEVAVGDKLTLAWNKSTNLDLFHKNKCKKRINGDIQFKYCNLNYDNALCELIIAGGNLCQD